MKYILPIAISFLVFSSCVGPSQRVTKEDLEITRPGAKAIVVVHSRSGNTAIMAKTISRLMNADFVRLQTPQGAGDTFFSTPNRNSEVHFEPARIDLAKYDLIFLGSPIWYWHPNAFIYAFIKKNDLSNKRVVLFYTYEGGISSGAVGEWEGVVKKSGGRVIDVVGVNRANFDTDGKLLKEVEDLVAKNRARWSGNNELRKGGSL